MVKMDVFIFGLLKMVISLKKWFFAVISENIDFFKKIVEKNLRYKQHFEKYLKDLKEAKESLNLSQIILIPEIFF